MQSSMLLLKQCQPIITVTNLQNVHGGGPSDKEAGEILVKFYKTFKHRHTDAALEASMANDATGVVVNLVPLTERREGLTLQHRLHVSWLC
jgi:hypothetical protein